MPNKLYVGNLVKVTKHELEEAFARFGRLTDIWISHKPSGFAFVEFLNSKDASDCVQALDGRSLFGTKLRVEFAKTESASQPQRQAKRARSRSPRRSRRESPGRGLSKLMLGSSSTRLLPPPKPSVSMLAPVYDRTPSPLVLVRRGGAGLYDDVPMYRSWDRDDASRLSRVSSSIVLPPIQDRSRSPQPRSVIIRNILIILVIIR